MEQENQIEKVENVQKVHIPSNPTGKQTKKSVFIAGIVFFALVLAMFVVICCFKGYILGLSASSSTPEEGIGLAVAIVIFIAISPFFVFPMLAFFITSVVLLSISIKSCINKIRTTSIVCLCVDIGVFVLTIVLLFVWILA